MSDQPTDKELFEAALTETPAPETVTTETSEGQPRDLETGQFRPKDAKPDDAAQPPQPDTAPAAAQQPEADKEAHVPSWRLREVREAREAAERRSQEAERRAEDLATRYSALERRLQQLSTPRQEPIDPYADLPGAIKQTITPIEEQFGHLAQTLTLRASRAEAIASHGRDKVSAMETAVEQAMLERHPAMPTLAMQMRQSSDPVGTAMDWFEREQILKETGGDIAAFRSKVLEGALKDPAYLAKAMEAIRGQATTNSQGKQPTVQIPPSLSRTPSAASPHDSPGTLADADLYRFATS